MESNVPSPLGTTGYTSSPRTTPDFRGWTATVNIRGARRLRDAFHNWPDTYLWLHKLLRHIWRNRDYLTPLKLLNIVVVTLQQRWKTEYVLGRPFQLSIEPTNICASRCVLCPTGRRLPQGRNKGMLPLEDYKRLLARYKRWIYNLSLQQWGDPTHAPDLCEMIRLAHQARIHTHVSTTLIAFPKDARAAEEIVASGLDLLTCSIHGASRETFLAYQRADRFAETLQKVRWIAAARDRLQSRTPRIQLHMVVTAVNEHEIAAFNRLAEELGCLSVLSPPSLNLRLLALERSGDDRIAGHSELARRVHQRIGEWLPSDERYILEPYRRIRDGQASLGDFADGTKVFDCEWPWKAMVINWDQAVTLCCGAWSPSETVGNLSEQSMGRIWNGSLYREARRSFKRRIRDSKASCASCCGVML